MAIASEGWVPLFNGPTVPAAVCDWLVTADSRGLRLRVEPDGHLHVGPKDRVGPEDLAFVRAYRDSIIATVNYLAVVDAGAVQ